MRPQSELLDDPRLILRNFRRTNMLGASFRAWIQERILVRVIVKAALRNDFQNGQGLVAENSDGEFATWDEFLDQKFTIVPPRIRHSGINFPLTLDDMHADRRALPRRLDYERNWNRRALANGHDLPVRRANSVLTKCLLGTNLIEGQLAFGDAVSGIGNSAVLQNSLHLAVFPKRSVDREEGQLNAGRQFEVRTFHIDLHDLRAQRTERPGHALARRK